MTEEEKDSGFRDTKTGLPISIEEVNRRFSESQKPDWFTVFAWSIACIALIVFHHLLLSGELFKLMQGIFP